MSSKGWKKRQLGDVLNFRRGHDLTKRKMKPGSYPVVGSNGIIGHHNEFTTDSPCITIGRSGNVGTPHITYEKSWAHNTTLYIDDFRDNNPEFVYYFLKSLNLGYYAGGSAVPTLNRNHIHPLEIYFPNSLHEQESIANILSTLDNKIELNNQINQTLEEMAQAIFKQWFVDFEFPNENGEPYKSSGGKFVESELGMIPVGWEIIPLDQIAKYQNGLAMQRFRPETPEKSLPVLKIKELNRGFTDKTSDRCRDDIDEGVKIDDGDIIFSWSGTLLVKIWVGGKAGLNQHLFKVTSEKYPKWFYYFWTKFHLERFVKIAADRATTMGHIKRSHLKEALVVVPNVSTLKSFTNTFSPLLDKKITAGTANRTLVETRDTLLPKLMSGEIRIPDAEQEVEACLQKSN